MKARVVGLDYIGLTSAVPLARYTSVMEVDSRQTRWRY